MNKEKEKEMMKFLIHKFASSGGKARAKSLSPERQKEIARMGGIARNKLRKK